GSAGSLDQDGRDADDQAVARASPPVGLLSLIRSAAARSQSRRHSIAAASSSRIPGSHRLSGYLARSLVHRVERCTDLPTTRDRRWWESGIGKWPRNWDR